MIHPSIHLPLPPPLAQRPQTHRTTAITSVILFSPMEEDDVEDLVHGANVVRPEYESALRFHFLILSWVSGVSLDYIFPLVD